MHFHDIVANSHHGAPILPFQLSKRRATCLRIGGVLLQETMGDCVVKWRQQILVWHLAFSIMQQLKRVVAFVAERWPVCAFHGSETVGSSAKVKVSEGIHKFPKVSKGFKTRLIWSPNFLPPPVLRFAEFKIWYEPLFNSSKGAPLRASTGLTPIFLLSLCVFDRCANSQCNDCNESDANLGPRRRSHREADERVAGSVVQWVSRKGRLGLHQFHRLHHLEPGFVSDLWTWWDQHDNR